MPSDADAKRVLARLIEIASGKHHAAADEMVWSFTRCDDWQHAAAAVDQAVAAEMNSRNPVFLSPPPGWLPPIA
jgi:hypothetical protein